MIRVPNWDNCLVEWAAVQVGRPFAWGTADCATLLREGLVVMYGQDHLPPVAGYMNLLAARRRLEAVGGVAHQLMLLGAVSYPAEFSQTGDVLIIPEFGEGETVLVALVVRARMLTTFHDSAAELLPLPQPGQGLTVLRMPHGR